MVAALALMAYCLNEVVQIKETNHVRMSTSEVYRVNSIQPYQNMSYYTDKVCINQFDDSLGNVKVYLEHGSCSDISTTTKVRKIEHSFLSVEKAEKLTFYWIKNTNFSFDVTIFSHQQPGNFTIYVFKHNYEDASDDCTDDEPPRQIYSKLEFFYPGDENLNNSLVNCTRGEFGDTTCFSSEIVVNSSSRYHTCIIWENPNFINVSYILNINEIRYTNTSKFDSIYCNDYLKEGSCCSSFGNIIQEASNPTCMLIKTTNGDNDNAYVLPDLMIETPRKWDGVTYPLYLFIILAAVFVPTVSLCCYTCYRKRHPQGYCLKLSVNDATCFC